MATIAGAGGTFNTSSGTKTFTVTPQLGDLIVIFTAHTGNTSAAAPTDDQADGSSYAEISACACVKAASADQMRVFVRQNLIQAAVSTIFSHAPGASSGGGLYVFAVRGLARTGANAVRQGAKQDNQASGTPTPVLGSAALTGNCLAGVVFNAANPATMTPRSSPAWSEVTDTGYNVPTTGLEVAGINSGETASSIAWGSSSASAFCAAVVEFDCSAEVRAELNAPQMVLPPKRK
jgi:hypothetical protein